METTAKLYTFNYNEAKTYLYAALFIAGNLLLPQLCHLVPQGGPIFLPIYFFTLIGAYKYGWQVGLLAAVCSPLLNHWLTGMPPSPVLPQILAKSVMLALGAAYIARRSQSVSIPLLIAVVVSYQLAGSAAEWLITGSLQTALQDARTGIPGMLLQVFGGYAVIKYCLR